MYKRQTHRILDAAYEAAKGDAKVGTTGKGIGPTYTDKVSRNGVRVGKGPFIKQPTTRWSLPETVSPWSIAPKAR